LEVGKFENQKMTKVGRPELGNNGIRKQSEEKRKQKEARGEKQVENLREHRAR